MALNLTQLVADATAEVQKVEAVVTGVEKLISDAKAGGSLTVDVADVEALIAPITGVVQEAEQIIKTDL
jgi:hypothetical protein